MGFQKGITFKLGIFQHIPQKRNNDISLPAWDKLTKASNKSILFNIKYTREMQFLLKK